MESAKNKKASKSSTLSVSSGINRPPSVNKEAFELASTKKKKLLPANAYIKGIKDQDLVLLSQAITIIESSKPSHQKLGQEIIEKCLPASGKSIRIGITGIPGVGKSTFIEELGSQITSTGRKLAVLTIDPSSKRSGGSILGDKTRMEKLSANKSAFIRPSPSSGTLGGVARKTRETITLCEAAGFDTIFIETVGVGQSEIAVHSMVDFFLLLMLAGSGDELQGIKRGIMEMADAVVITKADGDNLEKAARAKQEFKNALHFFPPSESGWTPKVVTSSAVSNKGLTEVWDIILEYIKLVQSNSWFDSNRKKQAIFWMHQTIEENLKSNFYLNSLIKDKTETMEQAVLNGEIGPFTAAYHLLDIFLNKK
ncbi:MAG: methylmalonyl Co-A mutase-associated GTPase MeaB [Bacteroidales bacterium]|nr:methylmalonyl Co-A mutase-associated GTPase MeaB [Bacteroidales bacterium]